MPYFKLSDINTLKLEQYGRYTASDIFIGIFLKENFRILTQVSLKIVPRNNVHWIWNPNTTIYFHENSFENGVHFIPSSVCYHIYIPVSAVIFMIDWWKNSL